MIFIRAIPFCQVSKQGIRREGKAITGIGGWKYGPCETPIGKAWDHALRVGASWRWQVRPPTEAALLGYLAKRLFQFGNQSVYALRGLNVGRLPRQGPVLDDLDFEFYSIILWGHSRHLPFLYDGEAGELFIVTASYPCAAGISSVSDITPAP
jgi:hypothetical protein